MHEARTTGHLISVQLGPVFAVWTLTAWALRIASDVLFAIFLDSKRHRFAPPTRSIARIPILHQACSVPATLKCALTCTYAE